MQVIKMKHCCVCPGKATYKYFRAYFISKSCSHK